MLLPREVPPVDDFYMGLSFWVRTRSKDPSTNVGSMIVGKGNIPLGYGYNGPPRRIDDNMMDWSRPAKYPKIVHAERNAIAHSDKDLTGSTIYITARPCSGCMLEIVLANISKVVYYFTKPTDGSSSLHNEEDWKETLDLAEKGKVVLLDFKEDLCGDLNWMQTEMQTLQSFGIFN